MIFFSLHDCIFILCIDSTYNYSILNNLYCACILFQSNFAGAGRVKFSVSFCKIQDHTIMLMSIFVVQGSGDVKPSPEEMMTWKRLMLQQRIDFDLCQIDPAPFQLVERTSLYKVAASFYPHKMCSV